MFQDFSDSFKAYLYDRTTSPLFGAFAASWSVWNYEIILTILSDWSVDQKMYFMETTLFPSDPCENWLYNYFFHSLDLFFIPFFWAIFILLAYPWPSRKIYSIWKGHQIKLHDKKLQLEKTQLVSNEVHEKLREEYFNLKAKLQSELRVKNEEIEFLQDSLNNYQRQTQEVSEDLPFPEVVSENHGFSEDGHGSYQFKDDDAVTIFKTIAKYDGKDIENLMYANHIIKELGKTKLRYYLDQFEKDGIITVSMNNYVYLTKPGRIVAVEQGFV